MGQHYFHLRQHLTFMETTLAARNASPPKGIGPALYSRPSTSSSLSVLSRILSGAAVLLGRSCTCECSAWEDPSGRLTRAQCLSVVTRACASCHDTVADIINLVTRERHLDVDRYALVLLIVHNCC